MAMSERTARKTLNTAINAVVAGGFLLLVAGTLYWVYGLTQRFDLELPLTLALFGFFILIFGIMGARLATAMQ
jgi:hypothetical protein